MSLNRRYSLILKVVGLALIGAALLAGCGSPAPVPPTVDVQAVYTQAAMTAIAGWTQNAPAPTLPPPATEPAGGQPYPEAATAVPTTQPYPLPTDTPPAPDLPSATPPPSATPALTVLFEDDFSRRSWYTESSDYYEFEYVDGQYRIEAKTTSAAYWSVRSQSLEDAVLQVDASRESGDADGYFGLVCRHLDGENYYALVIGNDGFYGIARQLDGEFEFLDEGVDAAGVIRRDDTNRIQADCVGDRLALYANGQKLLEVQDDSLEEGDTGVVAGTRTGDEFSALFDQFVIFEP